MPCPGFFLVFFTLRLRASCCSSGRRICFEKRGSRLQQEDQAFPETPAGRRPLACHWPALSPLAAPPWVHQGPLSGKQAVAPLSAAEVLGVWARLPVRDGGVRRLRVRRHGITWGRNFSAHVLSALQLAVSCDFSWTYKLCSVWIQPDGRRVSCLQTHGTELSLKYVKCVFFPIWLK